ncbi:MAG: hypothetical protein E7256_13305 [Lachnospiraceae bacterium]|nr:hypothetical protein [Lachnospiraceae bacterium]
MISSRKELNRVLVNEKKQYISGSKFRTLHLHMLRDHDYLLWEYVKSLRYTEYHFNKKHKIRYWVWQRVKNQRGASLGITMWHNTIGEGLKIWHYGSIMVNGHAKIGQNCQLHGENCIGNKGRANEAAPTIGNNVDIGVGAKVIGDIYIADNVVIGANAVVNKSCYEKGAVLVGVPARQVAVK